MRDSPTTVTLRVDRLTRAIESNRVAGQATGVLMAIHRIDADSAWELLVRTAQQTNIKVKDLSRALVTIAASPGKLPEALDPAAAHVVRTALLPTRPSATAPGELSRRDREVLGALRDALAEGCDDRATTREEAAGSRDSAAAAPPDGTGQDRASAEDDGSASATEPAVASEDRSAP